MGTFKINGAIVEIGKPVTIGSKTFLAQNGQVSMRNCEEVMGSGDFYHFQMWMDGQGQGEHGVFLHDLRRFMLGKQA